MNLKYIPILLVVLCLDCSCVRRSVGRQYRSEIRICDQIPEGDQKTLEGIEKVQIACPVEDWKKLFSKLTRFSNLTRLEFLRNSEAYLPKEAQLPENLRSYHWNQCDSIVKIEHLGFYLTVRHVQVSGAPVGLPTLLSDLRKAKRLEGLHLCNSMRIDLPVEVFGLTQIRRLDISHNHLATLPDAFEALENLEYLHLSGNQFRHLPEVLKRLPNLKWIELSDNPLELTESDQEWLKSLARKEN